jgi:hypothetical protein
MQQPSPYLLTRVNSFAHSGQLERASGERRKLNSATLLSRGLDSFHSFFWWQFTGGYRGECVLECLLYLGFLQLARVFYFRQPIIHEHICHTRF